jgi:predicted ATPase
VRLFRERAIAARPGVRLADDVVRRIVARLDGLPLAIELAAAKVRVMAVEEIDRRLEDRFALLRGGDRGAPDRHRTLLAVIDWSWNLLDRASAERCGGSRCSTMASRSRRRTRCSASTRSTRCRASSTSRC